jgi:hypothetical protein
MNYKAPWVLVLEILAAGLGVARAVADTPAEANPYAVISERNVFHLNAPPPPPVVEPEQVALPKVMLVGLLKEGSRTRALLVMPPKDQKGTVKYFQLEAGQKVDPLQLVKIDLQKENVDLINSGTLVTLTLASDGLPGSTAPGPSASGAAAALGMSASPARGRALALTQGTTQAAASVPGGNSVIVSGGANYDAPPGPANASASGGVNAVREYTSGATGSLSPNNGAGAANASTGGVYVPPLSGIPLANAGPPPPRPYLRQPPINVAP